MIVLNEKDYAIEHLESGDVGEKPFFTLSMIACILSASDCILSP